MITYWFSIFVCTKAYKYEKFKKADPFSLFVSCMIDNLHKKLINNNNLKRKTIDGKITNENLLPESYNVKKVRFVFSHLMLSVYQKRMHSQLKTENTRFTFFMKCEGQSCI